jgi:lipopolysaccharide/colanic/teichoic acid biosynthesis glycosyltransferase
MNLIIIHKIENSERDGGNGFLRFAISSEPVASVVFDGLTRSVHSGKDEVVCAIPKEWGIEQVATGLRIAPYAADISTCREIVQKSKQDQWLVVSNGRFATQMNSKLLEEVLDNVRADVVAITVKPELLAYHEKMRLTAQGKVAGFRRLYTDCAEPQAFPVDWPHHVFVRTSVLDHLCTDSLPQSFSALLESWHSNTLRLIAVGMAGFIWDLEKEDGLLNFCRMNLNLFLSNRLNGNLVQDSRSLTARDAGLSEGFTLCGKVLIGENVKIGPKVVMVGPTIIGNNVTIEQGAVVNSSIIGSNVSVAQGQVVSNRIVKTSECSAKGPMLSAENNSRQSRNYKAVTFGQQACQTSFRSWPRFSYGGYFKRIFDIIIAIIVLTIFGPFFPIIALVVKLISRGPVFFKDSRQGLHGKTFNCLKFRTMLIGADKMQDKLRVLNETYGPQFKIADDPRISVAGRFLRETYIDEVPQFFNVLLGQMSVVGPRPSPESENTLCPLWRDARLSVRPGITGLWQVCRTREPMRDFQEWIHYDIKYVRNLSLGLDLWICWQTMLRMLRNFAKQF